MAWANHWAGGPIMNYDNPFATGRWEAHLRVTPMSIVRPEFVESGMGGVAEFTSEQGRIYVPDWMLASLNIPENTVVHIATCTLPQGRFVKLQSQTVDFLDITNPRAVLEKKLRSYPALTKGETIYFHYAGKDFYMNVLEMAPGDAISILNADVEVDFAAPVGYVEPQRSPQPETKSPRPMHIVEDFDGEDPLRVDSYSSLEEDSSESEPEITQLIGKAHSISGRVAADSTLSKLGVAQKEEKKVVVLLPDGSSPDEVTQLRENQPKEDKLSDIIKVREERKKKEEEAKKNLFELSGRGYKMR